MGKLNEKWRQVKQLRGLEAWAMHSSVSWLLRHDYTAMDCEKAAWERSTDDTRADISCSVVP